MASRIRSISWEVLIARASASSGDASATVPKAWKKSWVKTVGSPTIKSAVCVPCESSSPMLPNSWHASLAASSERAQAGRGSLSS